MSAEQLLGNDLEPTPGDELNVPDHLLGNPALQREPPKRRSYLRLVFDGPREVTETHFTVYELDVHEALDNGPEDTPQGGSMYPPELVRAADFLFGQGFEDAALLLLAEYDETGILPLTLPSEAQQQLDNTSEPLPATLF